MPLKQPKCTEEETPDECAADEQQQTTDKPDNKSAEKPIKQAKSIKDTKENEVEAANQEEAAAISMSSTEMHQQQQKAKRELRKSTRSTRFKSKSSTNSTHQNVTHSNGNNGGTSTTTGNKTQQSKRNRRSLMKKAPVKLPLAHNNASTIRYAESLFYKGQYMQVGDIVSLVDEDQNVYYAQIRGLLIDSYCEKSAYLTWLIPTRESPDPNEKFDPATYLIGPDEDLSRKLSYLRFVMHAPSNYYFDRTQPFPLPDVMDDPRKGSYTWISI